MWFETVGFAETEKGLIVKVFWRNKCLQGLSIFFFFFFGFLLLFVNRSVTLERAMEIGKKRKSVWRRRIYWKYVSCNRLQKTQDEIYADVVLSRWRGSPGQWFPETEYLCASFIFVLGTSGILPKINYRNVKSYTLLLNWLRTYFDC